MAGIGATGGAGDTASLPGAQGVPGPAPRPGERVPSQERPPTQRRVRQEVSALPDRRETERAMAQLNDFFDGLGRRLEFGIVEEGNQLFVKLVDRENDRVVKVMPPEGLIKLRAKLNVAVEGLLMDERA